MAVLTSVKIFIGIFIYKYVTIIRLHMFIYIFPSPWDLQPCGSTIIQFLHVNIQNEYKFKKCDAKLLAFLKRIES